MKIAVWFIVYYCTAFLYGINLSSDGPYKVYRLTPITVDQLEFLKSLQTDSNMKVDFWKEIYQINTTSDVMVAPNLQGQFEKMLMDHDFKFMITIDDVQKLINEQENDINWSDKILMDDDSSKGQFNFRDYQDYSDMRNFMHTLERSYPSIAKVITLGYTGEKRPIEMIKISYPVSSDSKKSIWIDAGIHAREWIAPSTAMYFINELVMKYGKDPLITQYVSNLTWYITPVLNPDGYDYSRSSKGLKYRLWRKNRSPNDDACYTPGQCCIGTDVNRNFDEHWGEVGASEDPCKEDYRGSSAFSEPEARVVRDFVMQRKREIQAFITLHSYGQKWMVPYGYGTNVYPPDVAELKAVAVQAANALRAVYGTRYTVGGSADILYKTSGSSDDWSKAKAGIKYVYLIELRRGSFIMHPNQIIPTGRETWEGIKVVANTVLQRNGFKIAVVKEEHEESGRKRGRGRNRDH